MKLWVTGWGGVLGSHVYRAAVARGHTVRGSLHKDCPIEDVGQVWEMAQAYRPDAIINCAGALPGSEPLEMVVANALGPHVLATLQIRLVHMSTDCVFAGNHHHYLKSTDQPDPVDLYGRTKLAGEVAADHVLNVRGSFLSPHGGLLRWLLDSSGPVDAWERAYWNGGSAVAMADALLTLAEGEAVGVLHAASPGYVTKAELIAFFVDRLGLPVQLCRVREPEVWRVLERDYELPAVWASMAELAECVHR